MNTSTARIGYARVSTPDQNPAAQVAALEAAGRAMIRTGTGGATGLGNRPEPGTILEFIHPGETLVVTRIDRLARSMKDLQAIAATGQPVDTSTAAGKAFLDMPGVFAGFGTSLRRGRQAEGTIAARRRGSIAGGLRRSTWTGSGPGSRKGSHRPGSRAGWGSRAEPSTGPKPQSPAGPPRRPRKSGKTPSHERHKHRDLFAACSSRCPYMQLRAVQAIVGSVSRYSRKPIRGNRRSP